jgi:DNA-binding GntR family transcriptional regulator
LVAKPVTTRSVASSKIAPDQGDIPDWPVLGSQRTLAERVYQVVRDRILNSDLAAPGVHVREEELANAMGVSRTPVREALSRLATEGFLERLPHRGFRVPERSIEELVHLYPVVQALELLAGELAFPRMQEDDLEKLDAANKVFAQAVAENDVETAIEINDRFHHTLAELSGNPVLSRLLDDLRSQVHRLEIIDFSAVLLDSGNTRIERDTWVRQHSALIDAVRRKKFDVALTILRENRTVVVKTKMDEARAIQEAVR